MTEMKRILAECAFADAEVTDETIFERNKALTGQQP